MMWNGYSGFPFKTGHPLLLKNDGLSKNRVKTRADIFYFRIFVSYCNHYCPTLDGNPKKAFRLRL